MSACARCRRESLVRAISMGVIVDQRVPVDEARRAHGHRFAGAGKVSTNRADGDLDARLDAIHRQCLAANTVTPVAAHCRHDPAFPASLGELGDAPALIYACGDSAALAQHDTATAVAIVGARRATPTGREVAYRIARELAAAGVVVVSGMAFGIDAAAHRGALAGAGPTVAVLAGSPAVAHPSAHGGLHREIVHSGVVISEFPPGARVARWGFPARNRLIAALAGVTIVIEGRERSGALHTTEFATQLGRTVAAVPGAVTSPLSAAPNALLFDGAQLVRDGRDVLELLFGPQQSHAQARLGEPVPQDLDPELREVLEAVSAGAHDPAGVVRHVGGLSAARARSALGRLELLGLVRRGEGGEYVAMM